LLVKKKEPGVSCSNQSWRLMGIPISIFNGIISVTFVYLLGRKRNPVAFFRDNQKMNRNGSRMNLL